MKQSMKVLVSFMLIMVLIIGSSYTSYAKNTSIHLHVASSLQSIISGKTVQVVVVHDEGEEEESTLTLPMSSNNDNIYKVNDNGSYVTTMISHFLIDGVVFSFGPGGDITSKPEGQGTVNCYLEQLPGVTLTYNANGATSGTVPASQSLQILSTFTVSGNTGMLALNGHVFKGWNTLENGSGINYVVGNNYSIGTQNLTLFAQWTPAYPVTYHANPVSGFTLSGSVPTDSNLYEVMQNVTVQNIGGLALSNHTFAGWALNQAGDEPLFSGGSTVPMTANGLNFYAKWTMDQKYDVIYDANSGVGTVPSTSSYFEDDTVTVSGNTGELIKTGYTFNGWNTLSNGTGSQFNQGSTFEMPQANVTLYAQWKQDQVDPITYTVTYNVNGGSGTAPVDPTEYEQGDSVEVLSSSLSRDHFTFIGWTLNQLGTGELYITDDSFLMPANNVTLYAQWEEDDKYTVTYNGNGSTSGSVPVDEGMYYAAQSTPVKNNVNALQKEGYDFKGWNTAADGSGTSYPLGSNLTFVASNVTLYAVWELTPVVIPPTTQPTTDPPVQQPTTAATTEEETEEVTDEAVAQGAGRTFFNVDQFLGDPFVEIYEEIDFDEEVPLADALPQTGQIPAELFYGIGGLITAAGAFLKRK